MPNQKDPLIGERVRFKKNSSSPFILGRFLAGGTYGRVYIGYHEQSRDNRVAVKLEHKDAEFRQLPIEYGNYLDVIGRCAFTPEIFCLGQIKNWLALVMELLGPSLEDMYDSCKEEPIGLSEPCVASLGIGLFSAFEYVHGRGLIHRDVKPGNFMFGLPGSPKAHHLLIVDLGLSKRWISVSGEHIPYSDRPAIFGTPYFMSISMHKKKEVSRRDDLESLMYMLAYLRQDTLPWLSEEDEDWAAGAARMGELKPNVTANMIFNGMDANFATVFTRIKRLAFTETPEYQNFILHLHTVITKKSPGLALENVSQMFDWNHLHQKKVPRTEKYKAKKPTRKENKKKKK